MIHQCYFDDAQAQRLFSSPVYRPFRLTPGRQDLCEFEAMLQVWRCGPRTPFVGFTSWRQLDKSSVVFTSAEAVESAIGDADGCGWHWLRLPESVAAQAERWHPGVLDYIAHVTTTCKGESLVPALESVDAAFFASYWVLRWPRFVAWMGWMWPMLALRHPYLESAPKARAYALERLFIAWYLTNRVRISKVDIDKVM